MCEQVILFTRYPAPGSTKTRLIPVLGPDGAAGLQRRLTELALRQILQLRRQRPFALQVCYDGGNLSLMRDWLGPRLDYRPQSAGDLGIRMNRACSAAFKAGMTRVVILGADCPGLSSLIIGKALDCLRRVDIVLGPARDGGYYLIGVSRELPQLFSDIPWGTAGVFAITKARAEIFNISVSVLEPLSDVDRPADLCNFYNYSHS